MKEWISQNIVSFLQSIVPLLQTLFWIFLIGWCIKQFAPEIKKLIRRINKITYKGIEFRINNFEDAGKISPEDLGKKQEELGQKPRSDYTNEDWYASALIAYTQKNYDAAFHRLKQALLLADKKEQIAKILFNQGLVLGKLGRSEEEIAVYDEINRRYGQDSKPGIRKQAAKSLFNKGFVLAKLGCSEDAIAVYDEINRRYGQDSEPGIREQVAGSLLNKGVALGKLDHPKEKEIAVYEEEIAVYDEVNRRYGQDIESGIREQVAGSLFNKGIVLGKLNRPKKDEIAVYDEVNRRYGRDTEPGVRKQVAKSLFNKGVALRKLGRFEEASEVYDEVNRRYGQDIEPGIREQVASSLRNKGIVLGDLDDSKKEEEIAVYDEVNRRYGQDTEPGIREQVAGSLLNKGFVLAELDRFGEARAALRKAEIIFTELDLSEEVNRTKDFLLELENIKVNK